MSISFLSQISSLFLGKTSGTQSTQRVNTNIINGETASVRQCSTSSSEDSSCVNIEACRKQLVKNNKMFTDNYNDYCYVADGTETLKEIREKFGIVDGGIRKSSSSQESFNDSYKPKAGDEIYIDSKYMPKEVDVKTDGDGDLHIKTKYQETIRDGEKELKDNDGNKLHGFYEDSDGNLCYTIQSGDTKESIQKMLSDNKCFNHYDSSGLFNGYGDEIYAGHTVSIPEKGIIGNIIAYIQDWFS